MKSKIKNDIIIYIIEYGNCTTNNLGGRDMEKIANGNVTKILNDTEVRTELIMVALGIICGVITQNYFSLIPWTYILINTITEKYGNKCIFKKTVAHMINNFRFSGLLLVILIATCILSWKYFIIPIMLCIPQAILWGEYYRIKNKTSYL